jgi:hypothetical protein
MMDSLALRFARPLSIRRSLNTLARVSTHVLIISPSTRGALAFAQALVRLRSCVVTRGPVTASVVWPFEDCLRNAAEICQAFSGLSALPRTVISFPDQLPLTPSTSVMVPFLDQQHAFSTLDAILVMRHRPRVYALTGSGQRWGFQLLEVDYEDTFDADGNTVALGLLVSRLLSLLARDLAIPPADWLARSCLTVRSERALWMQAREEMKDIECLLRMQLQSRFCDRDLTSAALAAVVERQRILIGSVLP